MATVKPFAALRPKPELAGKICELPYDVMSSDEAREIAGWNPWSFLHVSKPEIDLPPGTNPCAPEVYAKGRENFQKLIRESALRPDPQPCFYLYRQVMGDWAQTGLVAVASCQEYLRGVIKKHELTRPDKEDDRVRHIETLNAQTGPVSLVYRAAKRVEEFVANKTSEEPEVDFTARDGVRHSSWTIQDAKEMRFIETEFAKMPAFYIADGHHRSAAAARVFQRRKVTGRSGQFLTVIFPHNQVQILPYNRVLKDLSEWSPDHALEILSAIFAIDPNGAAVPGGNHEVGLYLRGKWHTLAFRPKYLKTDDPVERLDVALLQKHVFEPVFGITDPRTSKRIGFVGGIRGTPELEKLVNRGEAACAFSLFPVSIRDLMAIADAGGVMPPKSTWFEPKLRDGMFCHTI